ncbi:hypothetical protein HMPREF1136_1724 [Actinomyces sp. ICM47]|nr:hypothetical protein HMPREF1136_1724 [Actinomyces sp. ICM47]
MLKALEKEGTLRDATTASSMRTRPWCALTGLVSAGWGRPRGGARRGLG